MRRPSRGRLGTVALVVALIAGPSGARADDPEPPWLGITYDQGGAAIGVLISEVHEDTAAAAAGLRPGDALLEIDDVPIGPGIDLGPIIAQHRVGDRVRLRFWRDGLDLRTRATLTARLTDDELLHRRLVDRPAPPLSLTREADGGVVELATLRGRVAIVAWFPPTCESCAGVLSSLGAWTARHERDPVVVIGATATAPAGLRSYLSRNPVSIPTATCDEATYRGYVTASKRDRVTVVVIDGRGTVRLATQITPGDDDRLDDVCVAAERAVRAAHRAR